MSRTPRDIPRTKEFAMAATPSLARRVVRSLIGIVAALALCFGFTATVGAAPAQASTQCGYSGMSHYKTKKLKRMTVKIYKASAGDFADRFCTVATKTKDKSKKDWMSISYGNGSSKKTKSTKGKKLSYSKKVPSGMCILMEAKRTGAKYKKELCV